MRLVFKILFLIVFPTVLSVLSQTDVITNYLIERQLLGNNFNIDMFKDICMIISIVLNGLLLGFDYVASNIINKRQYKRITELLSYSKEVFIDALADVWKQKGKFDINIRIFIPENKLYLILIKYSFFKKRIPLYFKIKNIPCWAKSGNTDKLKLRVTPNPQGLVGQCFNTKNIVYDANLRESNDNQYGLSNVQIHQTSQLTTSICVPVFDQKNNVIAVVAYDSIESICAPDKFILTQESKNILLTFANRMYKIVPELFK